MENRRFALHYVEMVIAMVVGMIALGPVWRWVFGELGWSGTLARDDVMTMSMATNMVIAMSLWMWFRGHGFAPIAEMAAAMYVPFVVLLVPMWLGVLSLMAVMVIGHVAMFAAMLLVMLRRREEYSCRHTTRWSRRTEPAAAGE
jgi:hypothetical protein